MNRGGDYGHQLGSSRSFLESFRSACSILLIGPIHCIPLGFFQNTRKNDQYAAETIEKVQMKKLNTNTRMKYLNTTFGQNPRCNRYFARTCTLGITNKKIRNSNWSILGCITQQRIETIEWGATFKFFWLKWIMHCKLHKAAGTYM